ncbi:DEKNAAC102967 [Brettanomyces naardenensis]|uniref:U three protein 7 n=1 Tax=Brettanomyces naardenensis TaxID=13370 RepID=A0A448YM68_BRENA|nr:DEKNAAC102967 [Brettanomyces naardenensis]
MSEKYERSKEHVGRKLRHNSKKNEDNLLSLRLKKLDKEHRDAMKSAARTDVLLQEEAGYMEAEGMEKTYKFRQNDIVQEVDIGTAKKGFELKLDQYGPYSLDYSRNGRELLIGGKKGHVAAFDWQTGKLDCELFLNETVHAVKSLHNDQFFAVAQKKYTFIYDKTGTELHRLKQHIDQTLLDFLPYHMLLVTSGNSSHLKYHDVSTGELVADHRTKMGSTLAMRQNPWNAVMHLGHSDGKVTLWSPSMPTPLVKIQACRGPVRALTVNRDGRYMAVSGADKTLKIWDIRKYEELGSYYTPTQANTVDISDTGLLSVGWGPHVTIWKDTLKTKQNSPYMNHMIPGSQVQTTRFVPFEDVLGCGHNSGITSIIVPGAGEANFDALESNPYESSKQRQETEVRSLLNKLQPDMIALDPSSIGTVDKRRPQERLTSKELSALREAEEEKERIGGGDIEELVLPSAKGKNSSLRKLKRKQRKNLVTERSKRIEKALQKEKDMRKQKLDEVRGIKQKKDALSEALSRFN